MLCYTTPDLLVQMTRTISSVLTTLLNRTRELYKVKVAVLGSPSLIVLMVDVRQH